MYNIKLSKEELEFATKHKLPIQNRFKVTTKSGTERIKVVDTYDADWYSYYCTKYFYKILQNHMRLVNSRVEKEQRNRPIGN